MKFVQLLVTDDQAELVAAALRDAEEQLKKVAAETDPQGLSREQYDGVNADMNALGRLQLLFQDASENPTKYPPTGKMAATVRGIARRAKGRSKTPSLSRKRASRHQRRRAERHFYRRNRKLIESYNKGLAEYEAAQAEYEASVAEVNERVKDQPTFSVTDGFGNVTLAGIPAEFIIDAEGKSLAAPKIEIAR